ncbi:30S ribosomal protein S20 [Candidatus Falkowbacteria bacterium]|nr:30S ribosomal protein S20 [Candidatus Falkowbacteria bacterium]
MPIKKAGFKALRQSKKRTARNLKVKSDLKKIIKGSRKLLDDKKAEEAKKLILQSIKEIDRAISKGIIKKNTGARKKSRLMKRLNALIKK